MNLHAVSYQNIGPFQDRLMTIFFREGKFLIKAPIGSGKSFLFFDGPAYGLYKYSSRNMLNILSKTGFIKLWFEVNDQHYLVVRNLKQGKSKDSCNSMLFSLGELDLENIEIPKNNGNFESKQDIEEFLRNKTSLEEIVFKNETNLQQNISDMLPPREVFQSTIFLMQDTDNIFELQPSERLTVLKNVFNLMGIDDAKEKIQEYKRQINTELKIKGDSSHQDMKLKQYLAQYLGNLDNLAEDQNLEKIIKKYQDSFVEIRTIADKLNITDFSLEDFSPLLHSEVKNYLEEKKSNWQKLSNEKEIYQKQFDELKKSESELEHKIAEKNSFLKNIENKIQEANPEKLENLKKNKLDYRKVSEELENSFSKNVVSEFFEKNQDSKLLDDWDKNNETNLRTTNSLIDFAIQKGKILKGNLENLEMQIEKIGTEKKNFEEKLSQLEIKEGTQSFEIFEQKKNTMKDSLDKDLLILNKELERLKERNAEAENQLKTINEKIQKFGEQEEKQGIFACEKIGTNCPFVNQINKAAFEQFDLQKKSLEDEKLQLVKKIQEFGFDGKIAELEKIMIEKEKTIAELKIEPQKFFGEFLAENQVKQNELKKQFEGKNWEAEKNIILQNKQEIQSFLEILKQFLNEIEWSSVKENYRKQLETEKTIKTLDMEIVGLEKQMQEIENLKLDKEKAIVDISHLKQQKEEKITKQKDLEIQILHLKGLVESEEFKKIQEQEKYFAELVNSFSSLEQLVKDFEEIKIQLKKLKQDEKIVNDLYQVFSKELLLAVLEDYLPSLSDIINNFLSKVVDYQINFFLTKSSSGKLEMEAKIYDEKGERDVKSLSGGQRVILKLVWMLAISSYMNASMLFLDETINNLDQETVGKVADMLSDFVKQREIKFYTVTHSQQIQDMEIWDEIIGI